MHEKQELKSMAVARQDYSTSINEEYEYSHEKAERVSLPNKSARIQSSLFTKQQSENKSTQTLQVKHI